MKKSLLLAGALLVLGASTASAQGEINLAFTDCGGASSVMFACNSNTGSSSIVGTFVAPGTLPEFLGISVDMNFQFTGATGVPDWWQHGAGLCRGTTGLATNFDFTANSNCLDFYFGQAAGGFAYDIGYGAANRSRLRIQCAVPFENRGPVADADGEYYAFKVNMLRSKTTGTGACVGCAEPVNVVLDEIQLFQPPEQANDPRINTPGLSNGTVGWQAGPTPVRNATWGQVKSLYR